MHHRVTFRKARLLYLSKDDEVLAQLVALDRYPLDFTIIRTAQRELEGLLNTANSQTIIF